MKAFTVYTKIGCPYCSKVIGALQLAELPYVEYKLGATMNVLSFMKPLGRVQLYQELNMERRFLVDAKKPSSILRRTTWSNGTKPQ